MAATAARHRPGQAAPRHIAAMGARPAGPHGVQQPHGLSRWRAIPYGPRHPRFTVTTLHALMDTPA